MLRGDREALAWLPRVLALSARAVDGEHEAAGDVDDDDTDDDERAKQSAARLPTPSWRDTFDGLLDVVGGASLTAALGSSRAPHALTCVAANAAIGASALGSLAAQHAVRWCAMRASDA